jgi:hypothetical protein
VPTAAIPPQKCGLYGGFAVILNGTTRTTKNIDLLVEPGSENVARIRSALSPLPDNAVLQVEDWGPRTLWLRRIADEIVVDRMAAACGVRRAECGVRYRDAVAAGIQAKRIGDVVIRPACHAWVSRFALTPHNLQDRPPQRPRSKSSQHVRLCFSQRSKADPEIQSVARNRHSAEIRRKRTDSIQGGGVPD